jgi:hypothetical protein
MFGTLVGAGGGFILMPIFFFLYPNEPPDHLIATSLAVVFFNALSGTVAYAKAGRVDYRSGIFFSLATFPGAILGAIASKYLSRQLFDPVFATLLIMAGIYLFLRPGRAKQTDPNQELSYSMPVGLAISAGVGFFSSILGIGGGIIHVPALVQVLGFPVHIATATSHFILAAMTLVGTLVHWMQGDLNWGAMKVLYLAPGAIIGAQFGAFLSKKIHGNIIIRALALALASVGIRLILR